MELKKIQIHKSQQKGMAVNQITLDDDYNVPDYRPDIMKLIKEKGEVRFDEIKVTTGVVWIKGSLIFQILYRSDQETRKISALKGEIPFQEKLSMDGLMEFDPVRVTAEIEDLSVGVINSRKLSVRALVVLRAFAEEKKEEEIANGILDEEGYEQQILSREMLELITAKKDTLRLKNEVVIPSSKPNIQEILWKSIELRHIEYTAGEGEVNVTGEALVTVFYYGEEEEGRIQWYETSVALNGAVDCPGISNDEVFHVVVTPVSMELEVKPDYDGEERILVLEFVLDVAMKVWKEAKIEVLNDLYSLQKEVRISCEETTFEKLLVKNYAKCKVFEQMKLDEEQEKILQICACEGKVLVEQKRMVPEGVEVEGVVSVEMLYMTTEDQMPIGVIKEMFPFQQMIEVPGITEQTRIELDSGMEQLSGVLLDQSQAEVKAVINLNLIAFEEETCDKITQVEIEERNMDALQRAPGLVGYIAKAGDSLWKVAKENHTTIDEIKETNQLKSENLKAGDQLLIVKKVL